MKKILITGESSYVGMSLVKWLANYPEKYLIDSISLRNDSWKKEDFSEYDVVIHVAGIAHIKETRENKKKYYKVNRDLAYEVAQKAKKENIKQFIFLSSMSVFGVDNGVININTPLTPKSNYGKSKLQAENLIKYLESSNFKIAIIRPPMIYGKGCKGNYSKIAKLALKTPLFPAIENKRSMIYIDNLCEFIRLVIENTKTGIFLPQNIDYVCTSEMVKMVAEIHGTKIKMTRLFNIFIRIIKINTFKKMFGDLIYERQPEEYENLYAIYDFETSIRLTEK
ncbi:NAD-dependent epimerase/dehydratase family protein [Sporosarcina sp. P29]|uniref:NAD-dependent epimerase/dehydratase family protein n=1 Tax=Sporosarcina sp. P29 TaxID=2048252 RepID=UPI000C167D00|nr:NAD-dependent epimerase/dehydratase family protein [Sporosarcina sp. P29]PIC99888.1 NAD-dependent epimerase [Sporosarcina sp. P29]